MSLRSRTPLAALTFLVVTSCAWLADLGDRKRPYQAEPQGGTPNGAGGDGSRLAGAGGDLAEAGQAGVPSLGAPDFPAVGLLSNPDGRACTGTLVGSRSVLTAASCFPGVGRGCISRRAVAAKLHFRVRAGDGDHTFPVRDIATYPLAYPLSAQNACDASCELADEPSVVDLRRGRDVALVYLDDAADGTAPSDVVTPLHLITDSDVVATDSDFGARHVYLDLERDFREGSSQSPLLVGYGASAGDTQPLPTAEQARGRFDLGDVWNRGCEQVPHCGKGPSLRNRCPPLPISADGDFFQDQVLRVLDAPLAPWVRSFLNGSSGSPLLVTRGAASGSLSSFHGDTDSVLGVLSDAEEARDGERVAAYVAPTFLRETGSWLAARLRDFDQDCRANDVDPAPTEAPSSTVCSVAPGPGAPWQRRFLDDEVSPAQPRLTPSLHFGSLAAATSSPGSVALFMVGADGVVYRTQNRDLASPHWDDWQSVITAPGLRSELSAFTWGNDTGVIALTQDRQLRFFAITSAGDSRELPAPRSPSTGFASAPAAVAVGELEPAVELFVRGSGAELLRFRYEAGSWSAPQTLGLSLTSAPSAVALGELGVDIFARSSDFHLLLWRVTTEAAPRSGPLDLGAIDGVPVAAAFEPTRVDVLARGANGVLRQRTRLDDDWTDWVPVNAVVASDMLLTAPARNALQAFATTSLSELVTFVYPPAK